MVSPTDPQVLRLPHDLDHHAVAGRFNRDLRDLVEGRGYREILIDVGPAEGRHFPNASVPIAAAIAYWRSRGTEILPVSDDIKTDDLEDRHWASFFFPKSVTGQDVGGADVFTRVWRFTDESSTELADWVVTRAQERLPFRDGVFEAFNWALWEVMDNVLQHSGQPEGFLEAQVHPVTKHLAVCVADAGRGIYQSFLGSGHSPHSDEDALTLAIREGVTRNRATNQGNGLWGLTEIVRSNAGVLRISSGRGRLAIEEDEVSSDGYGWAPGSTAAGTIVDFQLRVDRPIDLVTVLGHQPVTLATERFRTDAEGSELRVIDHARGMGTRRAGADLRMLLVNILTANGGPVVIDFAGVPVVSSSFADEFLGKIIAEIGFVRFSSEIHLRNVAPTVGALIDRAIAGRLGATAG